MRKLPGRISSSSLRLIAVVALSAGVTSPSLAFDGFSVNSNTFAQQYNGNQIWDGAAFVSPWTAGDGLTNAALSLSGSALVVNNAADGVPLGDNGWVQQDSGTSPWELGTGNWTIELSAKVNDTTTANDNFVLWTTVGGSRFLIRIAKDSVGYNEVGVSLIGGINNADAYHTFRVAYQANNTVGGANGTYHVWRDNVLISDAGATRVASDGTARLIVGDCCSSIGNPIDPFEIQYVRYSMTGAFSPVADQGKIDLQINRNTGAMVLSNTTGAPLPNIIGYSLLSAAGGLTQTGWDKQSTGSNLSNDNDQWTTLSSGTSVNELSEAVLSSTGDDNGGDLAATSGSWSFGTAWRRSPIQDVSMELLLDDGTILTNVADPTADFSISYTGTAIPSGDFNFDGSITAADWALFKSKFRGSNLASVGTPIASHQAELYNLGDINLDGQYSLLDFIAFEAAYDAVNGVGALAAIPEPATATLLVICGTTFMMIRRKNFAPRRGRLMTVLAVAVAAALGAAPNASAQNTISNAWSGAAGDRANYSAFIFKATAGTFPTSVSPLGALDSTSLLTLNSLQFTRPANDTLNGTNDPVADANPGGLTAKTAPVFVDVYTTRTGTSGLNFTGFLGSSTNSFAWEAPLGTETIAPGATFTFNFSNLLLEKNTEYWMVYSETSGDGDVGNFRTRVNTAATPAGTGYLATAIQTVTPGASPTNRDWGVEYVAQFSPVTSLKLRVNTTTGAVSILDDGSPINFGLNSYSITSASSLVTANWNSLQDQVIGGDPTPGNKDDGNSWEEFDNVSSAFLGEGFLTGSTVVADNTPLALGNIFSTSGAQDLAFTYTATNSGLDTGVLTGVVEYFSGGQPSDFDGDNDVDGNDFLLIQRGLGTTHNAADITAWKANFGAGGAVAAVGAVPEPSSLALLAAAVGGLTLALRKRKQGASTMIRRNGMTSAARIAAVIVAASSGSVAMATVTLDRDYKLGDEAAENAVAGAVVGSGAGAFGTTFDSAGVPSTGNLQDPQQIGDPTYVNVGPTGLARPGAAAGALGAQFDGTAQSIQGLDSANRGGLGFPGNNPPQNPYDNYNQIFSRGIQLWVRPTDNAAGERQDVVNDTYQFGIHITAANNWGMTWGSSFGATTGRVIDSTTPVAFNAWTHVMQRSYGSSGAVLFVNGVAVATSGFNPNEFYHPHASSGAGTHMDLTVATNLGGTANFFAGQVDNIKVWVTGDNTGVPPHSGITQPGMDYGTFDLGTDNEFVSQLGLLAGDVDLNGSIQPADATAFVTHWRKTFPVGPAGALIGDLNSRAQGDMNFDGTVNLADAFIVHAALDAVGLALNFELLSASVPEPSSWALLALGVAGFKTLGRRRGRRAC